MSKILCNCDTCGKEILQKPYQYNRSKHHYCSVLCLEKRNEKENIVYCHACKSPLSRIPCLRQKYKMFFCDKKCESKERNTQIKKLCEYCHKQIITRLNGNQKYCSVKCTINSQKTGSIVPCVFCKKSVFRIPSQIKVAKCIFCSSSCKGKYYAQKNNGHRRSSSEIKLTEMIKLDFPNLPIDTNIRSVLDCRLEIDIWIPEIKLAIELNGPCHYFSLYGEKTFKRTLTNDEIKKKEILQKGYNLLIININQPDKIVKKLLEEQYNTVIKPLLISNQEANP